MSVSPAYLNQETLRGRLSNFSNPSSQLLNPPKKTPVSSFLINRAPKIKAAKKIKRLSFKSTSPRNYNKRTAISKRKLAAIKRKVPSSKQTAKNKPATAKTATKIKPETKNNPKPITPKISDFALKQQNVKTGECRHPRLFYLHLHHQKMFQSLPQHRMR